MAHRQPVRREPHSLLSDLPMTAVYLLLLLVVFANLFPFLNLVVMSLRPHHDIIARPLAVENLSFVNYAEAQDHANILRGLLNGVYISACTIVVLLILGSLNAYALVFIRLRITRVLTVFLSLGYFIPPASILIHTFLTLRTLRLLNTYTGIVLVYASLFTSITMIILTGYLKTIPQEIGESAKIDGANHFRTYLGVILPLTKPVLVTLTILLFVWTYRDFMWPLVIMARPAKRTIAVALASFVSDRQFDFGELSAAVVVSLIPIVAAFVFLKEQIMRGMAAGSVKG